MGIILGWNMEAAEESGEGKNEGDIESVAKTTVLEGDQVKGRQSA